MLSCGVTGVSDVIDGHALVVDLSAGTPIPGVGGLEAAGQRGEGRRASGAAPPTCGAATPCRPAEAGAGRPGTAGGLVAVTAQGALEQLLRDTDDAPAVATRADRGQVDLPSQASGPTTDT
ncbi:hypothetical protein SCOCK_150147 [Actinacidiphila cocklensis]|uniref:Uncharacterized protein n=1 Tax=Actinacidiphila cocklensis TaxID=887465 RepID=A0A9W4GP74_9ACTN|nr:hypothetical protein SCOCK_150147 [Actinacidiphila cocklensis]